MIVNYIRWWDSCSRALKSVEYLFIAFTARFTQTWSDYTCSSSMFEPNRSIWKLLVLDVNTWNYIAVGEWLIFDRNKQMITLVNKKGKKIEIVSRHLTSFSANLRAKSKNHLTFPWLAIVFAVQKCLILRKTFFHLFSVYMILTDGNISQSKIIETSQFVFKPTNIGLLIEKYYFCNKSLKITWLNIPRPTGIFIESFNKLTIRNKTFVNIRSTVKIFYLLIAIFNVI